MEGNSVHKYRYKNKAYITESFIIIYEKLTEEYIPLCSIITING